MLCLEPVSQEIEDAANHLLVKLIRQPCLRVEKDESRISAASEGKRKDQKVCRYATRKLIAG